MQILDHEELNVHGNRWEYIAQISVGNFLLWRDLLY